MATNNYLKVLNGLGAKIDYVFFDETDVDSVSTAIAQARRLKATKTVRIVAYRHSPYMDKYVDGFVGEVPERPPVQLVVS